MYGGKIDYTIGFNVDKKGLQQINQSLDTVISQRHSPTVSKEIDAAAQSAMKLQQILNQAFDFNANALDMSAVKAGLDGAHTSLLKFNQEVVRGAASGQQSMSMLNTGILNTRLSINNTKTSLDKFVSTFTNTLTWRIAATAISTVTSAIKNSLNYVKDLDKSLNDIQKVTGYSSREMANFTEQAQKAAAALGTTTKDYAKGAVIFARQGLKGNELTQRTNVAAKVSNVTGDSVDTASDYLTAVWQGYKVDGKQVESSIDKLAAVSSTSASSLSELGVAMSKVASAANTVGVPIDNLTAQIATIIQATRQAPESVGTALKTVYARMGDLKVGEADEFGVKLGEVSSQMKNMGINILNEAGQMKDMGTIIDEVSAKWNGWSQAQKQAAAIAMAGKRQYNNLYALFENQDVYQKELNISQTADGTLEQQNEVFLTGLEAGAKRLENAKQGFYTALWGDNEQISSFYSLMIKLMESLTQFTEGFGGGLKSLIGLATTLSALFSKQLGNKFASFMFNRDMKQRNEDTLLLKGQAQSGQIPISSNIYNNPTSSRKGVRVDENDTTQTGAPIANRLGLYGIKQEDGSFVAATGAQAGAIDNYNFVRSQYQKYSTTMNRMSAQEYNNMVGMIERGGQLTQQRVENGAVRGTALGNMNQGFSEWDEGNKRKLFQNLTHNNFGAGYDQARLGFADTVGKGVKSLDSNAIQNKINNAVQTSDVQTITELKNSMTQLNGAINQELQSNTALTTSEEEQLQSQQKVIESSQRYLDSLINEDELKNKLAATEKQIAQANAAAAQQQYRQQLGQTAVATVAFAGMMGSMVSQLVTAVVTGKDFTKTLAKMIPQFAMMAPMMLSVGKSIKELSIKSKAYAAQKGNLPKYGAKKTGKDVVKGANAGDAGTDAAAEKADEKANNDSAVAKRNNKNATDEKIVSEEGGAEAAKDEGLAEDGSKVSHEGATGAKEKETGATWGLHAATLALIAVIAILIIGFMAWSAHQEAVEKRTRANNEALAEQTTQSKELAETVSGLKKEYKDLYEQYRTTGEGAEELINKQKEIIDQLKEEGNLDISGLYAAQGDSVKFQEELGKVQEEQNKQYLEDLNNSLNGEVELLREDIEDADNFDSDLIDTTSYETILQSQEKLKKAIEEQKEYLTTLDTKSDAYAEAEQDLRNMQGNLALIEKHCADINDKVAMKETIEMEESYKKAEKEHGDNISEIQSAMVSSTFKKNLSEDEKTNIKVHAKELGVNVADYEEGIKSDSFKEDYIRAVLIQNGADWGASDTNVQKLADEQNAQKQSYKYGKEAVESEEEKNKKRRKSDQKRIDKYKGKNKEAEWEDIFLDKNDVDLIDIFFGSDGDDWTYRKDMDDIFLKTLKDRKINSDASSIEREEVGEEVYQEFLKAGAEDRIGLGTASVTSEILAKVSPEARGAFLEHVDRGKDLFKGDDPVFTEKTTESWDYGKLSTQQADFYQTIDKKTHKTASSEVEEGLTERGSFAYKQLQNDAKEQEKIAKMFADAEGNRADKVQEVIKYVESRQSDYELAYFKDFAENNAQTIATDLKTAGQQALSGELTDFQFGQADTVKDLFPELSTQVDTLNNKLLVGTQSWYSALLDVQTKMQDVALSSKIDERAQAMQEMQKDIFENEENINFDVDDSKLDDFIAKLNDVADKDYEITVQIKSNADDIYNTFVGSVDKVNETLGKIQEGFLLDADAVKEFGETFPGALENAQYLEDGTVKLNQTAVQGAMESAKAVQVSAYTKTVVELESQQQILASQIAYYKALRKVAEQKMKDGTADIKDEEDLNEKYHTYIGSLDSLYTQQVEDNAGNAKDNTEENLNLSYQGYQSYYDQLVKLSGDASTVMANNVKAALKGQIDKVSDKFTSEAYKSNKTEAEKKQAKEDYSKVKKTKSQKEWKEYIAKLDTNIEGMESAYNSLSSDKAGAQAKLNQNLYNLDQARKGKNGDGSSTTNQADKITEEVDLLKDINNQLAIQQKLLDQLSIYENRAYGTGKLEVLKEENKALQRQYKLQKQQTKQYDKDVKRQGGYLKGYGAKFRADGTVSNYVQIFNKLKAQANGAAVTASKGNKTNSKNLSSKADISKEKFEDFKNRYDKYNSAVQGKMDAKKAELEAEDKIVENKIKQIEVKLQVSLDEGEMRRNLIDLSKSITPSKDFTQRLKNAYAQGNSYIASKEVKQNVKNLEKAKKAIDIIAKGKKDKTYGTNMQKAIDDTKKYLKNSVDNVKAMQDAVKDYYSTLNEQQQDVKKKFDDAQKAITNLIDQTQYAIDVAKLIHDDSGELSGFYKQKANEETLSVEQYQNAASKWGKSVASWEKKIAATKAKIKKATGDTKKELKSQLEQQEAQRDAAYDNQLEAEKNARQASLNALKDYQEAYTASIQDWYDDLEDEITNGKGFTWADKMWEVDKEKIKEFYDNTERLLNLKDFQLMIQIDIDASSSDAVKKQLQEFSDEQTKVLENQANLTEYDFKLAKAKYEILKKEIALRNAQENKNTLRLRRNNQGNYTYQYVANQSQIAKAQQELNNSQANYYKLTKDEYMNQYDSYTKKIQSMMNNVKEIASKNGLTNIDSMTDEDVLNWSKNNIGELVANQIDSIEKTQEKLHQVTEDYAEASYMTNMYYTNKTNKKWSQLAKDEKQRWMIDTLPALSTSFTNYYSNISEDAQKWQTVMVDVHQRVTAALTEYKDGYDKLRNKITEISPQLKTLLTQHGNEIKNNVTTKIDEANTAWSTYYKNVKDDKKINELVTQIGKIADKIGGDNEDSLYKKIKKASEAYDKLTRKIKKGATVTFKAKTVQLTKDVDKAIKKIKSKDVTITPKMGRAKTTYKGKTLWYDVTSEKWYTKQKGGKGYSDMSKAYDAVKEEGIKLKSLKKGKTGAQVHNGAGKLTPAKDLLGKKGQIHYGMFYIGKTAYNLDEIKDIFNFSGLASGGYTGEWNSSQGKLAVLHEKELVLNKKDTANMLQMVEQTRAMARSVDIGSLSQDLNSQLTALKATQQPILVETGHKQENGTIDQTITINADFPNVENAKEIEKAFNNLVNTAAQRIYKERG